MRSEANLILGVGVNYWLMKSEPDVFSFAQLKARGKRGDAWSGVRNYQARNFMRAMRVGDLVLFYHSSCAEPGVAGVARVVREAYPDHTAWERGGEYEDPASTPEKPRWEMVDVAWQADLAAAVPLTRLRAEPALAGMWLLRRGSRLSVTPVTEEAFTRVCAMGTAVK
jgi:predicted RNA-binding protein with PUA-like domain